MTAHDRAKRPPTPARRSRGRGQRGSPIARSKPAISIVVEKSPISSGYSGTPLPRKLGIKPGSTVALLGAPRDFKHTLGVIPPGTRLVRSLDAQADLIVWFVKSASALDRGIAEVRRAIGRDGVWIAWPKKASGVRTDVTETSVREAGLAAGIVDFKVCAIDAVWSGLKFQVRRA